VRFFTRGGGGGGGDPIAPRMHVISQLRRAKAKVTIYTLPRFIAVSVSSLSVGHPRVHTPLSTCIQCTRSYRDLPLKKRPAVSRPTRPHDELRAGASSGRTGRLLWQTARAQTRTCPGICKIENREALPDARHHGEADEYS